jgi:heme A synthase
MLLVLLGTVLETAASMFLLGAILWFALWKRVDDGKKFLALAVYPLLLVMLSCLFNGDWSTQHRVTSAATAILISVLYVLAWKRSLPPFPACKD